jgi:5'-nucleotidase
MHPVSLRTGWRDRRPLRLLALVAALGLLVAALAGPAAASPSQQGLASRAIDVQLLSINDFHGNLEPPSGSSGRIVSAGVTTNAGGVEYLATHLRELEATNPKNTLIVSAGDNIGASPLISGFFHDEPAIEALNALGLDVSSVGNHEFDEGAAELLRMQNGGCHPVDGCFGGDGFSGADFPFLSANVVVTATGKTLFPAYMIKEMHGVKIGFIGLTLEGTPTIVTPAGVAGLTFLDEVETINKYTAELQSQHVETIVVLIHEGGIQSASNTSINGCDNLTGAIVDIANGVSPAVDVMISGHTHQFYNCVVDKGGGHQMLLTSASSFGRLVTDIDLKIDRATKDVVAISANNVIVTRDVPKDAAETAIVTKYKALSDSISQQVVGSGSGDITRTQNAAGESALGDVIADAQLEAMDNEFGAVVAFMNPGGIRADLVCEVGETPPCSFTFGELFTVQPFNNDMVAYDISGADIHTLLEQQFDNPTPGAQRFLQVSSNFTYEWSASMPVGSKVDPTTIKIGGVTVNPAATYRIATNIFLAGGGDNFTVLGTGTGRVVGPIDLDALVAYFGAHSPVSPPTLNRIVMVP